MEDGVRAAIVSMEIAQIPADLVRDLSEGKLTYADYAVRGKSRAAGGRTAMDHSTITFGSCRWIVLEKKNGKALIMSETISELRPYHGTDEPVTWETCDLRAYLNGPCG